MPKVNDKADIQPELYIGLMSGTSVDGIDTVVAKIGPSHFELINSDSIDFPAEIKSQLLDLCHASQANINEIGSLNTSCGQLIGQAVKSLLKKSHLSPSDIRAIGSHGQTVRHCPEHPKPFTTQLGDASIVAEESGILTIADFRMADIACGGQGAPLVPAFHNAVFRSSIANRAIINIGGISNITILPKDPRAEVTGYDIGPGNTLMDQWTRDKTGEPFDLDGNWARAGKIIPRLLDATLSEHYFLASGPKSTGRELFNLEWLGKYLSISETSESDQDIQATLAELTAITIAETVKAQKALLQDDLDIYLCGGGVNNHYLLERIQHHIPDTTMNTTDSLNIDPQLVEASAFAWLAYRTYNGLPGNLPCVTGARKEKILGGIYQP
jgi:anhydro-N-acetylmuramic acid kinase